MKTERELWLPNLPTHLKNSTEAVVVMDIMVEDMEDMVDIHIINMENMAVKDMANKSDIHILI